MYVLQVVDEIYDKLAATIHQVTTAVLVAMEKAMKRDNIEGQIYLNGMAAAANFAWVNRSSMTFLARQAIAKMFNSTPYDLDMNAKTFIILSV